MQQTKLTSFLKRKREDEPSETNQPTTLSTSKRPRLEPSSINTNLQNSDPTCRTHGVPCKRLMVTKESPNKGKIFWRCSLPKETQCDFFMWDDDRHKSAPVASAPKVNVSLAPVSTPSKLIPSFSPPNKSISTPKPSTIQIPQKSPNPPTLQKSPNRPTPQSSISSSPSPFFSASSSKESPLKRIQAQRAATKSLSTSLAPSLSLSKQPVIKLEPKQSLTQSQIQSQSQTSQNATNTPKQHSPFKASSFLTSTSRSTPTTTTTTTSSSTFTKSRSPVVKEEIISDQKQIKTPTTKPTPKIKLAPRTSAAPDIKSQNKVQQEASEAGKKGLSEVQLYRQSIAGRKKLSKDKVTNWAWLETIRDENGKFENDPDYDPTTLYVPSKDFIDMTSIQQQYWKIKKKKLG